MLAAVDVSINVSGGSRGGRPKAGSPLGCTAKCIYGKGAPEGPRLHMNDGAAHAAPEWMLQLPLVFRVSGPIGGVTPKGSYISSSMLKSTPRGPFGAPLNPLCTPLRGGIWGALKAPKIPEAL